MLVHKPEIYLPHHEQIYALTCDIYQMYNLSPLSQNEFSNSIKECSKFATGGKDKAHSNDTENIKV